MRGLCLKRGGDRGATLQQTRDTDAAPRDGRPSAFGCPSPVRAACDPRGGVRYRRATVQHVVKGKGCENSRSPVADIPVNRVLHHVAPSEETHDATAQSTEDNGAGRRNHRDKSDHTLIVSNLPIRTHLVQIQNDNAAVIGPACCNGLRGVLVELILERPIVGVQVIPASSSRYQTTFCRAPAEAARSSPGV